MSFLKEKVLEEALTFDDVLVIPQYSEVLPAEVDLKTHLTRNIIINIPLISAAMDTITESKMAIAIAREGGIGVIHKNMSIEQQVREVIKVKRAESGMIYDPITITPDKTVQDALSLMKEYKIGGIPVVNEEKVLVGIVTNRDLRFETNLKKPIKDVMTKENLITVNQLVSLEKAAEILQKYKIEKLPVVDSKNVLIGLITYKDIQKAKDKPNACKDEMGRLRVSAAIGISKDAMERVDELVKAQVDCITIDSAHAHTKSYIELLRKIKKKYPNLQVIAGNVVTAEAAIELYKNGADAVKVGIGPGSICTTRVIAGVGVPQITAIYNVSKALEGTDIPVIADGGVRYSGDIVKAIAAGAHCVMSGNIFAGVDETPGETIIYQGRKFKIYRGMGSLEAMQAGSKDRYYQDVEEDIKKLVPEGITGRVPYKGMLSEVLYQILGGIKAGMGYCGAKNISELRKAKFIKITHAGFIENHPHDVTITNEAPNYFYYKDNI